MPIGTQHRGDLAMSPRRLDEQISDCLLAMVVDAMSGMVTPVRPRRRDEMDAYHQALPLCDPGKLQPTRRAESANA